MFSLEYPIQQNSPLHIMLPPSDTTDLSLHRMGSVLWEGGGGDTITGGRERVGGGILEGVVGCDSCIQYKRILKNTTLHDL